MYWIDEQVNKLRNSASYRSIEFRQFENHNDFSSNDYLGLAGTPWLSEAASEAALAHGAGNRASRLVLGQTGLYEELEGRLEEFFSAESALVVGSGYLGNLAAISSLADKNTTVVADHKIHASLIDGIRLSGARLVRFRHNDKESFLRQIARSRGKLIVVIESLYSMDGDSPDIDFFLNETKKREALLVVDEAHAVGVFGKGLLDEVSGNVVKTGTFSKALGGYGGYIVCDRKIREVIVNRGRSLIYSTALPPSVLGSAVAAIKWLDENIDAGKSVLERAKIIEAGAQSHIVPVIVSNPVELSRELQLRGFIVPAMRVPTVSPGEERLRISVCLHHDEECVRGLSRCLEELL